MILIKTYLLKKQKNKKQKH